MTTSLQRGAGPHVSRAGEETGFWMLDCRMTVLVSAEDTGGQLGVVHVEAPPGHEPPPHVHRDEDEAYFMLGGRMTVRCGTDEIDAEPGTLVFLPRRVVHGVRVTGHEPARFLMILTPGGFEAFFRDQGTTPTEPGLPSDPPPPDLTRIAGLFARHNIESAG